MVEQWSEESRTPQFAKLLGDSRLIPIFRGWKQWSQQSIVLRVRRAGRAREAVISLERDASRVDTSKAAPTSVQRIDALSDATCASAPSGRRRIQSRRRRYERARGPAVAPQRYRHCAAASRSHGAADHVLVVISGVRACFSARSWRLLSRVARPGRSRRVSSDGPPATGRQAIGSLELTRHVALVSEAGLRSSFGK